MDTFEKLVFVLTFLAALGSGLIAGVFFIFSVAVMKALGRIPPAESISAMQSINIVIINPIFLGVFLGTGAACIVLIIGSILRWQNGGASYLLIGALLYLIGSIIVTMVCNVPMNDALAAASPADPKSADLWSNYLSNWTFWNHVRTLASLAATAMLTIALVSRSE
jgi:uncharacterized membrane protein